MAGTITLATDCRSGPSWYALYTRHQHEKAVAQILSGKGFEVFLPVYLAVRRWKDRDKQLHLPLFPCYVFIRGGALRRLDVVMTRGSTGLSSAKASRRRSLTMRRDPQILQADSVLEAHRGVLVSP